MRLLLVLLFTSGLWAQENVVIVSDAAPTPAGVGETYTGKSWYWYDTTVDKVKKCTANPCVWTVLSNRVYSVFGRNGDIAAATNDYTWAQINKGTSSLADITTRSASDLTSGTLATAQLGSGTANATTFLRGDQTWAAPTASAAWGSITGTLSAQTDLQSALDLKSPTSRTISTTSPLGGGGDLSGNRTLTCTTCALTTNGGTLTATSPASISAAGLIAVADATATVKGLVPTPPNNTTTFLRGDATFTSVDLSTAGASGVLAAARFPALTGNVTTSAGALATTIANAAVTNAMLAPTSYIQGLLHGTCSGIATSSVTVYMFPLGQYSAFTCTVTAAQLGIPINTAGTIKNLRVVSSANGKASTVVTVLKDAVAQSVTCSLNGVSLCSDTSNSFTFTAGQKITVKLVTSATETVANVSVSMEVWN